MKLVIKQTLELTEEQATINGHRLKVRELKDLASQALDDLFAGQTVCLADLSLKGELMRLLTTPEALEKARQLLQVPTSCPPPYSHVDLLVERDLSEAETAAGPLAYDLDLDETQEIPAEAACLRCEVLMTPDEVGLCTGCGGRLHPACHRQDVVEYVEANGPLTPRVDEDGEKLPPAYECGACLAAGLQSPAEADVPTEPGS